MGAGAVAAETNGRAPVIVIGGPTASGKSALAVAVAEALGGVAINADSMQLYRELSVVTARPDAVTLERAPHRLFGVLGADDPCSAGRWRTLALTEIAAAHAERRLPIVVGGTGLYLKALTEGIDEVPDVPAAVREAARERHKALGPEGFHAELARRDPEAARRLSPTDRQRLIRAFEVHEATGRPLSAWHADAAPVAGPDNRYLTIVLAPPRAALYAACDARFSAMLAAGALDEVKALLALRLDPALPLMKAVGVRELGRHLAGEISLDAAIEAGRQATRRYAKRQYTWFRHQSPEAVVIGEQYSESLLPRIFKKIRLFC